MFAPTCIECGLKPASGQPSCADQRDELLARDYEQAVLYWQFHRMAVDAYCLQHSAYVESAKSLAAHLCGLCIAFEHGNDPGKFRQLQHWLSTNPKIGKPALPTRRGEVTIGDVYGIADPSAFGEVVKQWARSAWQAYAELHTLAREWIAMSASPTRSRQRSSRG